MSHFLTDWTHFSQPRETFLQRPRRRHRRRPHLGRCLPQPLGPRQDRALHPRRELHGLLLVEDLRQGRHRHLGDQQTDYPRTRWDLPTTNRAAAARRFYSWYLYSANRVKYPMVRGRPARAWREARLAWTRWMPGRRSSRTTPSGAWSAGARPGRLRAFELGRGQRDHRRGQRLHHQEIRPRPRDRLLADPGHVDGQLPPAAATSLIGGVCMSFYDWYCDLPPSSPQIWGEQTDVPESADWYNSPTSSPGAPTCRRPARRRALLHRGPLQRARRRWR